MKIYKKKKTGVIKFPADVMCIPPIRVNQIINYIQPTYADHVRIFYLSLNIAYRHG